MKRTFLRGARFKLSDVPADVERVPVELIAEDGGLARGILYRREGTRPRVGVVMLHPRMDQSQSYILLPLIAAGYAALGCAGRYVHNDTTAIQEKLLLDVASAVRALHDHGCEQVVLIGNSGGGGLLSLYQAQARAGTGERLRDTPSGEAFDLNTHDLPAADGLVLIAAHPGEGSRLSRWLDPSLTDEDDPTSLDPSLDMYDPANGFRVPPEPSAYSTEFLERHRIAQHARAVRLDGLARERLAVRADSGHDARALEENGDRGPRWRALMRAALPPRHLVISRMLACPEWVDTSIEPDDRDVVSFNNDPRPDLQNYEESFAPFLTPEAFLSTWNGLSTRAEITTALPGIPDPLLVVHYAGDPTTRISEARHFVDISAADDKQLVLVRNTDHWGYRITGPHQRGERTAEGTDAVVEWMRARLPLR